MKGYTFVSSSFWEHEYDLLGFTQIDRQFPWFLCIYLVFFTGFLLKLKSKIAMNWTIEFQWQNWKRFIKMSNCTVSICCMRSQSVLKKGNSFIILLKNRLDRLLLARNLLCIEFRRKLMVFFQAFHLFRYTIHNDRLFSLDERVIQWETNRCSIAKLNSIWQCSIGRMRSIVVCMCVYSGNFFELLAIRWHAIIVSLNFGWTNSEKSMWRCQKFTSNDKCSEHTSKRLEEKRTHLFDVTRHIHNSSDSNVGVMFLSRTWIVICN